MSTTLRTYSPKLVEIQWAGLTLDGIADGTFVEVERNSPNTNATVGAGGTVGLTYVADKTGMVRLTFMQTSDSNIGLSAVQVAQDSLDDVIRADMTITDKSGSMLCYIQAAHIQTPPPMVLADDQQSRTWEFFAERVDYADTIPDIGISAGKAAQIASVVNTAKEISKNILG